jgi:hypothetical protein
MDGRVDQRSRKTSAKLCDYCLDESGKGAVTLSEASQTREEELDLAVFGPLFSTDILEIGRLSIILIHVRYVPLEFPPLIN